MDAVKTVRFYAPKDTWNLANNGINHVYLNADTFVIYVDENIAPYMPYTNEKWINRKGKNPNEGWWQDTVQDLAQIIADEFGGELKVL